VEKRGLRRPFNLIVTHLPGWPNARDAERQLYWLLDDVDIVYSRPSLILAKVSDPREAVARLRRSLPAHTPILRVIPVDAVTYPRVEEVRRVVHDLLANTGEGTYAIKLDGHLYSKEGELMHKIDSIRIIAEGIERKVNLSNPDILVYIRVVPFRRGRLAAIYVGPKSGILSTVKERETG